MATVATLTRTVRIHGYGAANNGAVQGVFREIINALKPLCHASSPITIATFVGDASLGVVDTLQCDCDYVAASDTTFVAALNSATHGPSGNQTWAQVLGLGTGAGGQTGAILDTDSISSTLGH